MLYLRRWRLYRNLTLKQLQGLSGIDFRIISKLETKMLQPPTAKLVCLAEALGIQPGDLYTPPPEMRMTDETPLMQEV